MTKFWGKLLALGLVLAGTYAYLYSDLVVRRVGVYLPIAVFTLLWAEVLLITLVDDWPIPTVEVVIAALALTALAVNLLIASMVPTAHGKTEEIPLKRREGALFRSGPPLGLILSTLPVLIGIVLQLAHRGRARSRQYLDGKLCRGDGANGPGVPGGRRPVPAHSAWTSGGVLLRNGGGDAGGGWRRCWSSPGRKAAGSTRPRC